MSAFPDDADRPSLLAEVQFQQGLLRTDLETAERNTVAAEANEQRLEAAAGQRRADEIREQLRAIDEREREILAAIKARNAEDRKSAATVDRVAALVTAAHDADQALDVFGRSFLKVRVAATALLRSGDPEQAAEMRSLLSAIEATALGRLYFAGAWRSAAFPVDRAAQFAPSVEALACRHTSWIAEEERRKREDEERRKRAAAAKEPEPVK